MPSTPNYYYGWQPSPPDFRDHIYQVSKDIDVAALPPSVDLSQPPVFDQGKLGSCGPHSAAADIIFAAKSQQHLTEVPVPSLLFVYYNTRLLMGTVNSDSGVNNRSMLKALAKYGWCDETLHPYNVGTFRNRPSLEAFTQAATRRIAKYESVPQDLLTMKAALAAGDTFIFGFTVYSSMETAAVARTGDVPMPKSGDRVKGGHDVLICGFSDDTQRFKFKNSWGAGWGNGGYGTIPYQYATHPQLAGDFWTITHSALPDPQPAPAPGGELDLGLFEIRYPSEAGGLASIHIKAKQ